MANVRKIILLLFSASVAFRIAIFFPGFFPNVDAAEFATFVREITLNSGMVPAHNSIYFPGSSYIYPPSLFLFTHYIDVPLNLIFGESGYLSLYTLLASAVAAGALMNVIIYRNTANSEVRYSRLLSFFIPAFFGVDIYALTWGGYPYIVDTFFVVVLLFVLDREDWRRGDYVIAGLMAFLIPLTHDLTWFVAVGSLIVILVFNLLKKRAVKIVHVLFTTLITVAVGLFWWLPRLGFLMGVLSLTQSTGAGPFSPIVSGGDTVLLAIPFAVPILLLALFELIASVKSHRFEKVDSFTLALITTAFGFVFIVKDPVILARIILYSYTFLMVMVLKNVHVISRWKISWKNSGWRKKLPRIAVILLVVIGLPSQFILGYTSSTYYSSSGFSYDPGLVAWASTHMENGTVAAPEIGNYLASIDGNSVIIYSGFLVGQDQITQRNAVFDLMFYPSNQSTADQVNHYNIRYLVIENSFVNTTVDGHYLTFQRSPFTLVAKFQYYTVYSISYA